MIGKIKSILLGVLCAVCLQVPVNVSAVDLPIVPVEESQVETNVINLTVLPLEIVKKLICHN